MAARRRTRKTTRRRSPKPMINVLNTAQTLVIANAATRAFFGTNLQTFMFDGWARPITGNVDAPAGATGWAKYAGGSNNSWELSAAELIRGIVPGGQGFGMGGTWTIAKAVKHNLQQNPDALATMVLAPVGFKVAKKILANNLRPYGGVGMLIGGLATDNKVSVEHGYPFRIFLRSSYLTISVRSSTPSLCFS